MITRRHLLHTAGAGAAIAATGGLSKFAQAASAAGELTPGVQRMIERLGDLPSQREVWGEAAGRRADARARAALPRAAPLSGRASDLA